MDQPPMSLLGRWLTIRYFFYTLENGFIIRPYHLCHVLHSVLGQLMTSVKVEVGRYDAHTPNNQGFGPLQKIMEYNNQQRWGYSC